MLKKKSKKLLTDKQEKILFIYPLKRASFIKSDISILEKKFNVSEYNFLSKLSKYKLGEHVSAFFSQLFFLLKNINKIDIFICYFSGFHSVLPVFFSRLLNKKSVIILGGTESVSFPSFKYGNFRKRPLSDANAFSLQNASLLIPIHKSILKKKNTYSLNDPIDQGIFSFIDNTKAKINIVEHGFDSDLFYPSDKKRIPFSFLTICSNAQSKNRRVCKGVDSFIELAKEFPSYQFTIIGSKNISILTPKNLKLIDYVPNSELRDIISNFEFYVQLSCSEGFGMAVAEAMLCGCIPVVSNVGALPELALNSDFVVPKKVFSLMQKTFKKIGTLSLEEKESLSKQARAKIVKNYPLEKKEKNLIKAIKSLFI